MATATQEDRERITEVKNLAVYQYPGIVANYRGQTVRLIALGDSPGHSPVCQFVDTTGKLQWASQAEFTVSDPSVLPPSRETMQHITETVAGRR